MLYEKEKKKCNCRQQSHHVRDKCLNIVVVEEEEKKFPHGLGERKVLNAFYISIQNIMFRLLNDKFLVFRAEIGSTAFHPLHDW